MQQVDEELISYIHAKQREIRIISQNHLQNIAHERLKFLKIKTHLNNFIKNDMEYYNRFFMMSGLRGVGKTTLLYQLYDYLIKHNIPSENIFYLDVHDLKSAFDCGVREIFELYLQEFHNTTPAFLNKKIFLLVDEAQLDKNWANYARLLFNKTFNIFMIFTGSSALKLEVNVDASRRVTKEHLLPCGFQEYLLLKHNVNLEKNNFKNLILNLNEDTVNEAINCEKSIKKDLINLNNDPQIEFKKFLHYHSFPFTFNVDEIISYRLINDLVDRIIQEDLKYFSSFTGETNAKIPQLISFLAAKKPGNTSSSSLSQSLNLNIRTVDNILNALEKSQLIFGINAYGSAGKILNKPKEYFFLTPSIKAASNYRIGRYDLNHKKCYSLLVENLIASILNRLSQESFKSIGLFYDSNKGGVDFIVKILDEVILIEVGVGKKTKSQLTKALNNYDANYGILISNRTSKIKFKNNILSIPILSFSLV